MKKGTKLAAIVAGVLLAAWFAYIYQQRIHLSRENARLTGFINSLTDVIETNADKANKERDEMLHKIAILNGMIDSANTVIAAHEQEIETKDEAIGKLEGALGTLTDKDAIIANLTSQVQLWKDKFAIAQGVIVEKDRIIFNLTEKYVALEKISATYKLERDDNIKLAVAQAEQIKTLNRELKYTKLTSSTKTLVLVVGLVLLGVKLL